MATRKKQTKPTETKPTENGDKLTLDSLLSGVPKDRKASPIIVSPETHARVKALATSTGRKIGAVADLLLNLGLERVEEEKGS